MGDACGQASPASPGAAAGIRLVCAPVDLRRAPTRQKLQGFACDASDLGAVRCCSSGNSVSRLVAFAPQVRWLRYWLACLPLGRSLCVLRFLGFLDLNLAPMRRSLRAFRCEAPEVMLKCAISIRRNAGSGIGLSRGRGSTAMSRAV